jgi:MFS family permease
MDNGKANYSTMTSELNYSNHSDDGSDNGKNKQSTSALSKICPPPSFYDHSGTTRPYYLFPLFVLLNIATMADRAIIPGASKEFSAFLSDASDAPAVVRENPDAGLGILQAGFIGGYSVAIVLSSHYVHKIRWKTLVLVGLTIWWFAVLGSGTALTLDSYYMLLVSRMSSGVSEAAFHVVAPPLIQDRSGRDAGLWLSVYLCGMPVGLAVGYVYGSFMA